MSKKNHVFSLAMNENKNEKKKAVLRVLFSHTSAIAIIRSYPSEFIIFQ